MAEKLSIVVGGLFGKIPLEIYTPDFTWRSLIFPPIKSIIVQQGKHAAEIGDYEQYNFFVEVSQQAVGSTPVQGSGLEIRRFYVLGAMGKRVDIYAFDVVRGSVVKFEKTQAEWGSEINGASTTGWKVGVVGDQSGLIVPPADI